jgi:hypothetical protein
MKIRYAHLELLHANKEADRHDKAIRGIFVIFLYDRAKNRQLYF